MAALCAGSQANSEIPAPRVVREATTPTISAIAPTPRLQAWSSERSRPNAYETCGSAVMTPTATLPITEAVANAFSAVRQARPRRNAVIAPRAPSVCGLCGLQALCRIASQRETLDDTAGEPDDD